MIVRKITRPLRTCRPPLQLTPSKVDLLAEPQQMIISYVSEHKQWRCQLSYSFLPRYASTHTNMHLSAHNCPHTSIQRTGAHHNLLRHEPAEVYPSCLAAQCAEKAQRMAHIREQEDIVRGLTPTQRYVCMHADSIDFGYLLSGTIDAQPTFLSNRSFYMHARIPPHPQPPHTQNKSVENSHAQPHA